MTTRVNCVEYAFASSATLFDLACSTSLVNSITKSAGTGGYNAGASSQTFAADGYVEWLVTNATTAKALGLSEADPDQNYTSIKWCILTDSVGGLTIYELGVSKYTGTYAANDKFKVKRVGTTLTYYKNDVLLYTSATTSANPLLIDSSFSTVAASDIATDIKLVSAGVWTAITWANVVGVTTTVAGARFETSAVTVTIPETTGRTFKSVILDVSFRDAFSIVQNVTNYQLGIKLGTADFDDLDLIGYNVNSSDHSSHHIQRDITDYFTAKFSGSSLSAQASFAASVSSGGNLRCISAKLIVTYEYDDTGLTTTARTLRIPIQSHHAVLPTASQTEIGTSGLNPAPANQIPALDSWLPVGAIITEAWLEIVGQDGDPATADYNLLYQIDAIAEVDIATIKQTLQTSTWFRCFVPLTFGGGGLATNVAHAFKLRNGVRADAFPCMGAILHVTYTFDASTVTSIVNSIIVPLTKYNSSTPAPTYSTTGGEERVGIDFEIQEPGTPTLMQSAVVAYWSVALTVANMGCEFAVGAQAVRDYTFPENQNYRSGYQPIIHRLDHGSPGITLARGSNHAVLHATIPAGYSGSTNNLVGGYVILNYKTDIATGGVQVHNQTSTWHMFSAYQGAGATTWTGSGVSTKRHPTQIDAGRLQAYLVELFAYESSAQQEMSAIRQNGEGDGGGYVRHLQFSWQFEFGAVLHYFEFTSDFKRDANAIVGELGLATVRNWRCTANNGFLPFYRAITTAHWISFAVAGTVTGWVTGDGSGIPIDVFDVNDNHVASATTAVGGTYTVNVFDNTVQVYAVARLPDGRGRASAVGTAGTSTFNIDFGSSVAPAYTIISPTPGTPISSSTPIVVNVTATAVQLRRVWLSIFYGGLLGQEVVYDGDGFGPQFQGPTNTRTSVAGGYQFTILRDGGWHSTPSLKVQAVDQNGNLL